MKKIYLLTLGVVASAASFAQTELKVQNDGKPLQYVGKSILSSEAVNDASRGTGTCTDTSRWAWGRSFQSTGASYFSNFMHADTGITNAYGTYVPVPTGQSVDISGFSFYASSLRPDGASVSVNAVLYAASADSLPMGAALATIAVSVDTSTTNFIEPMLQEVSFPSAITHSGAFILSIENSTAIGDSISLLRGFTGSGVADNFPVVFKAIDFNGGVYTRLEGTQIGARLPHFYPYITFNQTNDFTMSVNKLGGPNDSVDFTYEGPSATDHPVLSISGFLEEVTSTWNFQDASGTFSARDTGHVFVDPTKDYQVSLTDSLFMWNGSVCVLTQSHLLEQAWPASINDVDSKKVKAFVMDNNITVQNAEGLVTIYSITGAVVKKAYVSATTQTIDASDLNEGVYILTVNDQAIKFKL